MLNPLAAEFKPSYGPIVVSKNLTEMFFPFHVMNKVSSEDKRKITFGKALLGKDNKYGWGVFRLAKWD